MATLPSQGGSSGTWGTELNEVIEVAHNTDGKHKYALLEYDHYADLATAVADAISQDIPLHIPAGSITGLSAAISITGNCRIVGDGKLVTSLTWTGNQPAFTISDNVEFYLEGVSLIGDFNTSGENGAINIPAGANDRKVYLESVDITGWQHGVHAPAGDTGGVVEIHENNCVFQQYQTSNVVFAPVTITKRLFCHNCTFLANTFSHQNYLHPHISFDFNNCSFYGGVDWAIQVNGSGLATPEFQRVRGCYFDSTGTTGIVTGEQGLNDSQLHISDCRFACPTGVLVLGDTVIDNCLFDAGDENGITTFLNDSSDFKLNVNNCQFRGDTKIDLRKTSGGANGNIIISNCSFFPTGTDVPYLIGVGSEDQSVQISGCKFILPTTGTASCIGVVDGKVLIDNCYFQGTLIRHTGAINAVGATGRPADSDAFIRVMNCTFMDHDRGPVVSIGGTTQSFVDAWANRIEVENCFIKNQGLTDPIYGNNDQANIDMPANNFAPRNMRSPTSIASAATIVINSNYNFFTVTGTTTIATINWWDVAESNKLFAGIVRFELESVLTITDTGNINPTSTSPRSAGDIISMVYDPVTDIWTEF